MARQVLLDENLPRKLRLCLSGHTVVTTAYLGWAGLSNGALIAAAEGAGFDALVTADQSLNYQQNLKGRKLALVVLSTNKNSRVMGNALRIGTAIDCAEAGSFTLLEIGP